MDETPGWMTVDCGCCAGIEWGGEEPRECRRCGGAGVLALHLESRMLALWPGGPFVGRASQEGIDWMLSQLKLTEASRGK